MKKDLGNKYEPQQVEEGRYDWWKEQGLFKNSPHSNKEPFTIILPPPNVTGKLHIGHAWDGSLQDALIRFKKLNGFDTLYVPGMDHAGIATQTRVEAHLKIKGLNRWDLGREKFLEETWKWKEEYSNSIRDQWAKLGLALNYDFENFTLNPEINQLVNHVFVEMYNKGLIYRGKRIVNWDPIQKTAVSNIEVIYKETQGFMYYFKYQLVNSSDFLIVATTRPETMFADQCLVVNPKDKRYQKFLGQEVINPVNNQKIPVIADDYVDQNFGTGVMKCTPAHDVNDFEIGDRHNLPKPLCLNEDGTINELGGPEYQGLERLTARKKILDQTTQAATLLKQESITHQVGYSERSNAIIEPFLSDQWFVKMGPLAKKLLAFQKTTAKIQFFPERFSKVLEKWMETPLDWTISRQLWWGHQIPAWYNKHDQRIYVGLTPPQDLENWNQDLDVLDTWFSSALWPFATLNWNPHQKSATFTRYYPTNVLVTGYDIIFFWVARMIFQSLEFTTQKPFNDVLIHGLVRDEHGRKMSKSLGNGIDPMDVIGQYGTDSLRFFLLTNSTPGQDIRYSEEKIRSAWNFMNKLWNASRYVLSHLGDDFEVVETPDFTKIILVDTNKWILNELTTTMNQVQKLMTNYEFGMAGKEIYDFVWTKYCSWFIEFAKVNFNNSDVQIQTTTKQVLVYVLKNILIMLHPFAPFITEYIYQFLNLKSSIMLENWIVQTFNFETEYINVVTDLISSIREFRSKNNINLKQPLTFNLSGLSSEKTKMFSKYLPLVNEFTNSFVNATIQNPLAKKTDDVVLIPVSEFFLEIENSQFISREDMINTLKNHQEILKKEIQRSEALLHNENFLKKANAQKIQEEKAKYADYQLKLANIEQTLQELRKN